METSPRAPISQRSREQVMKRRQERAERGATPPRAARSPANGSGETAAGTPAAAGKLQAGLERAEAGMADKLQAPPALPPPKRAARSSTPALAAPLPAAISVGFGAPATPAATPKGGGNGGNGNDAEEPRERTSSRVHTPTMYQDDDEGDDHYADEHTSLLTPDKVAADSTMQHNAKIMEKLIKDVEILREKDEEIERVQEELAQIDDEVDDACETMATFVSLTFNAPTFSWLHMGTTFLLTMVVWGLQAFLTFKLYNNAKINDGGQAMLDLGSGYLELNHTMASAECDGACTGALVWTHLFRALRLPFWR